MMHLGRMQGWILAHEHSLRIRLGVSRFHTCSTEQKVEMTVLVCTQEAWSDENYTAQSALNLVINYRVSCRLLFHQRTCFGFLNLFKPLHFHTQLLPLLHLKCQHKPPTPYCDRKRCVAERKKKYIKVSLLISAFFLRFVFTYCTHELNLLLHIYIVHLLFSPMFYYFRSGSNYDTDFPGAVFS